MGKTQAKGKAMFPLLHVRNCFGVCVFFCPPVAFAIIPRPGAVSVELECLRHLGGLMEIRTHGAKRRCLADYPKKTKTDSPG